MTTDILQHSQSYWRSSEMYATEPDMTNLVITRSSFSNEHNAHAETESLPQYTNNFNTRVKMNAQKITGNENS